MPPDNQFKLPVCHGCPCYDIQETKNIRTSSRRRAMGRSPAGITDSYSFTHVPLGFSLYEPAGESALLLPVTVIVAIPVASTPETV